MLYLKRQVLESKEFINTGNIFCSGMHSKMQRKTELENISSLEISFFLVTLIRKLWSFKTVRTQINVYTRSYQVYANIVRHVMGIPPEITLELSLQTIEILYSNFLGPHLGMQGLGYGPRLQNTRFIKAESLSWHLTWQLQKSFAKATSLTKAVLTEAKISMQLEEFHSNRKFNRS